jgi:hypothetical protein
MTNTPTLITVSREICGEERIARVKLQRILGREGEPLLIKAMPFHETANEPFEARHILVGDSFPIRHWLIDPLDFPPHDSIREIFGLE